MIVKEVTIIWSYNGYGVALKTCSHKISAHSRDRNMKLFCKNVAQGPNCVLVRVSNHVPTGFTGKITDKVKNTVETAKYETYFIKNSYFYFTGKTGWFETPTRTQFGP